MIDYDFCADKTKGGYSRAYVARITGSDPKYVLRRDFLDLTVRESRQRTKYSCEIPNGVYECCIRKFRNGSDKVVDRKRWWAIVADDDLYEVDFDEMSRSYALCTAYNVRVNMSK